LVSCAALVLVGLVNSPAVGAFADPLLPVPTAADLSTSNPSSSCATSPDDAPFVNLNTITGPVMNIRTTVAVTEVVTATVELWQRDGAAPLFTSTSSTVVSSTGPGTVRVGFRFDPPLADGEYFWRARVTDAESGPEVPWSPSCYLNHDATRPAAPVISSTDFPSGQVGLGVGRKGTFRLAASDADVIGFEYTFGSIIPVGGPILPVGPDGSATITFVPIETGPGDVVARTVDRAGNRSAQTEYHFFVGVASGPAAVWHFDDGSGTVAAGDPGPAGTLTGGAAFSTDGKVGGAVRLDGTSGYVSTPLTLGTGTTFAVSAWVRLADTRQDQPVLAEGDASGDSFSLSYRADLAHWTFSATAATATTDVAVSAASPERGEWTHLAGVYDGYSLRLYVDGHADGVVGHPVPAPAKGTVQVGSDPAVADRFLAGEVDEVRVFDRAVFPGELHAMVNADDTATPVGVWHFDDTVGHVAADSSSGDHPIGSATRRSPRTASSAQACCWTAAPRWSARWFRCCVPTAASPWVSGSSWPRRAPRRCSAPKPTPAPCSRCGSNPPRITSSVCGTSGYAAQTGPCGTRRWSPSRTRPATGHTWQRRGMSSRARCASRSGILSASGWQSERSTRRIGPPRGSGSAPTRPTPTRGA